MAGLSLSKCAARLHASASAFLAWWPRGAGTLSRGISREYRHKLTSKGFLVPAH